MVSECVQLLYMLKIMVFPCWCLIWIAIMSFDSVRGSCVHMLVSIMVLTRIIEHFAVEFVWIDTGRCPVSVAAGATGIVGLWASIGHVTPSLAFQAVSWFFFAFLCIHLFLAYNYSIGQHFICNLWVGERDERMSTCLVR